MSAGFNKINKMVQKTWIEVAARGALRDVVNTQKQQLYITYGTINKALLMEEASDIIPHGGDITTEGVDTTIKDDIDSTTKRRISNQARKIFKDLLVAARKIKAAGAVGVFITDKMITFVGTFDQISELKWKLHDQINNSSEAKGFIQRSQLGHTIGVSAVMATAVKYLSHSIGLELSPEAEQDIEFILEMEADSKLHSHITRYSKVSTDITLTLELELNMRRGAAVTNASTRLKQTFADTLRKALANNPMKFDVFLGHLINTPLSNTITDDLLIVTAATFKGKRAPDIKKTRRANTKSQMKAATKPKATTARAKKSKKSTKNTGANSLFGNLLHLQNVINLKLHDTLKQEVMGQGGDPVTLNYRTGRFARSAYVNQLVPMKGGLEAQITWQRYPYDTFAPGGRLHTAMRDPNFLIGQSIREILKEVGLQSIMVSTRSQ